MLFFLELEEEERRKRALQLQQHENKCYYLKLDPAITPMFPQYPEFFFDPASSQWHQMPQAYPEIDVDWGYPGMALLPLKVRDVVVFMSLPVSQVCSDDVKLIV